MAETIALWKFRRKEYINLLEAKRNNTSIYLKQKETMQGNQLGLISLFSSHTRHLGKRYP